MKPTYIALDTETGGIGRDVSLLTAYIAILDEDFDVIDELAFSVKPDDGIFKVTAEALTINKLDLIKVDAEGITAGVAGGKLRELLSRVTEQGKIKLVPVGHNVGFDLEKVYDNVLNKKEAQKYVSYRLLDTGVVGQYLKAKGKIPESVSGSLGSYATYFDVPKQELHTARGDTLTTVAVMRAMLAVE